MHFSASIIIVWFLCDKGKITDFKFLRFFVDNCDIICYNSQGFDDFNQNNFLPCAEVGLYKPVIRTGVSTNCLKQFTIIPVKGRSIMFWRFFYCP